ncbi:MAG: hypothetical protein PHP44_06420 [Kiritimatiellae bacterium]|nr:hypothetical protein [Kiritimatiellia bacterium]
MNVVDEETATSSKRLRHPSGCRMKRGITFFISLFTIAFSLCFFIYPVITISRLLMDDTLKNTGQSRLVPAWFQGCAHRYARWAETYLNSEYAARQNHQDVAATEWPMFGSVFFLVTAQDLQERGLIDAQRGIVHKAIEEAAAIVVSPVTASWVKQKWGDRYLEKENVFYGMLLILGLSSYEALTGDRQYHDMMCRQRTTLARELAESKFLMKDDYPGECYPNDVLWAVAAIQRAAELDDARHDQLARELMAVLDGPLCAPEGLPAFQVDAVSGWRLQGARGSGNSGILLFAPELDRSIAARWYAAYANAFWSAGPLVVGFRETPHGQDDHFMDVDSGPVVFGLGSAASAFGIGAAKAAGRLDHAVPLTLEAVACSWPTPFGFIVPGLLSYFAVQSWSLGEVALLFSMTRPIYAEQIVPYDGSVPGLVWILLALYFSAGIWFILMEIRSLGKQLFRKE